MGVTLGSIDEDSLSKEVREKLRLEKHIFVSQKACWFDVKKDGLPTFERFSGTFEEDLEKAGRSLRKE